MKINLIIHFNFIIIIISLIFCSYTIPPPIPQTQRLKCAVLPLIDLTGQYDKIEPKFEEILLKDINNDYVYEFIKGKSGIDDMTIGIPNIFIGEPIKTNNKNIYELKDKELVNFIKDSELDILIIGKVQQIKYGSPKEIEKYIIMHEYFGIVGLASQEHRDRNSRSGLVEYYFNIFDKKGTNIGDFLIQGFYNMGQPNREKIIEKANKVAVENLIFKLHSKISKKLNIKRKEFVVH